VLKSLRKSKNKLVAGEFIGHFGNEFKNTGFELRKIDCHLFFSPMVSLLMSIMGYD